MENLVSEFMRAADPTAVAIAAEIVATNIVSAFAVVTAGYFGAQLMKNRIGRGRLMGHSAVVGETFYTPSGKINPDTMEEFSDQKLRTYEATLDLRTVFHPAVAPQIMRYMDKAAKLCTVESPIVFKHLEEVVPAKEFPRVWEMVTRQWKNYFSQDMNAAVNPHSLVVGERQDMVEVTKIPLLVYEASAAHKQYRVLLIPTSFMDENALPRPENTRVEQGTKFVQNPAHYLNDRLRTNHYIAQSLREDPGLLRDFGVKFMTGEVRHIPVPTQADKLAAIGVTMIQPDHL